MRTRSAIALFSVLALGCGAGSTGPDSTATAAAGGDQGTTTQAPIDGPLGSTQIVVEIGGRSIILPNVALCLVTDEQVEISASAAGGTTGVTVSWRADQPPAQTSIVYVDLGLPGTFVTGPDVSADSPPLVTVSGKTAEIVAELHDAALDRPPVSMRLLARCPDSPGEDAPPPTAPPGDPSGNASVSVDGVTYEFGIQGDCNFTADSITLNVVDADGNALDLIVIGETGFLTFSVTGRQWVAGLSGEPVQPTFDGGRLSWSGAAFETFGEEEMPLSFSVECAP